MGVTAAQIRESLEKIDLDIRVESLNDNEPLTEQGFDSLDMITMFFMLEKEFSVDIPDTDVDTLKTLNDLAVYISNRSS